MPSGSPLRAPDPRPARTRAAILDAIEKLGAENAEITVAAVVTKAQLSRSSFYSQFRDVGDVAVQLIREVYDSLQLNDSRARERRAAHEATTSSMRMIIAEFSARRHLYAAVLGSGAGIETHLTVRKIMADGALKAVGPYVPAGIDPVVASQYLAGGVLASIVHWIMSESPTTEEVLLEQILKMLPDWVTSSPADG